MNAAQIHLALNHVPLFLSVIGGGILIFGMIKKNESFKTLSLYLLVAAALFALPVFFTGEGTEELVEKLPGVQEAAIEKHEDMAKAALAVIIAGGVIALAGLFFQRNRTAGRIIFIAALILSLASFGVMAQTAHLGGLIRHNSELNSSQQGATDQQNKANTNESEKERSDEKDD